MTIIKKNEDKILSKYTPQRTKLHIFVNIFLVRGGGEVHALE